ncbi:sigma-70 family RNA polymerase sigma factor [Chitinophaga sp. SYP-B3965]|uniref:RNA polymerase sigma factor n=1 Tax=Chitinophaga sp. SYP-B3965 TaxID=2663120 RepID=UPI0012998E6E|nr:sigma-70 family RNA polymerase sigma factor [Chitinophaga sp. SYP-B3965]MRG47465.1 sigma-70 family RNA polymerase sigma factor [Chitinophaga sp. SYP-B3965]
MSHADQHFIHALLHNETQVVGEIYQRFAPKVKYYVLQNSGSADDAADIFQESLVDIYNQAKYKDLQLTCPFEAFLLMVCKRKWLNELKKRGRQGVTKDLDEQFNVGEDSFRDAEKTWADNEKARLFKTMLGQMGERCQEIIRLSLTDKPQEEIAAKLGVTYGYLRKKKSECMASLISAIKDNLSKWGLT